MLEVLNRYSHGLAIVPVVSTLRARGCLEAIERSASFSVDDIASRFGANRGPLAVALRLLAAMGWLQAADPSRYAPTAAFQNHRAIPADILSLYQFPFADYVRSASTASLQPWIDRSRERWGNQVEPVMADMLDGVLSIPLLLALIQHGVLRAGRDGSSLEIGGSAAAVAETLQLFGVKDWLREPVVDRTLTPAGRFIVERIRITAALSAYRPMFSRMDEILFGNVESVFARDARGDETHIDRALNVTGSSFQHGKYFAALSDLVVSVFDNDRFDSQPKCIVDTGCGDGSLLRALHEAVVRRTPRGRQIDRYPLTLVAADFNQQALDQAALTLKGLNHFLLRADVADPAALIRDLRAAGVDADQALHVRSFLDHDRAFVAPRDVDAAHARKRFTDDRVYVSATGEPVAAADMMQSTVEHLRLWAQIVNEHGLAMLEVHSLSAPLTARFMDESESLHFDAYHGFSRQCLLGAQSFLACAAEVGLFAAPTWRRFPQTLPFTRITLNHFHRRPYSIRYANAHEARVIDGMRVAWRSAHSAVDEEGTLSRRIEKFPTGTFLLECDGSVLLSAECRSQMRSGDREGSAEPAKETVTLTQLRVAPGGERHFASLLDYVEQHFAVACIDGSVREIAECRVELRGDVPMARAVVDDVRRLIARQAFDPLHDPRAADDELGKFALDFAAATLRDLGWRAEPVRDPEATRIALGIVSRYERYIGVLLRAVERNAADVSAERPSLAAFKERFAQRYPRSTGLLNFTVRCLERYEDILTGRTTAEAVVFADGNLETFSRVFDGDVVADYFNSAIATAVEKAVERARTERTANGSRRTLRILEVGAGTGATAAAIAARLGPDCQDVALCFTDVSQAFLRHGRRRLQSRFPWIDYQLLDVEKEPNAQGFEDESFDVIVASNVLHDTRRIDQSLRHLRQLSRRGGMLLINEYTAAKDCLLVSGALLRGPWSFEDGQARLPDNWLSSDSQWERAAREAGFDVLDAFTLPTQAAEESPSQCLLLFTPAVATANQRAGHTPELSAERTRALRPDRRRVAAAATAGTHAVENAVEKIVRQVLGADRSQHRNPTRPYLELGLDSIELLELKGLLQDCFGVKLSPAFLFDHETEQKTAAALRSMVPANWSSSTEAPSREPSAEAVEAIGAAPDNAIDEPIAIVGIACRFPGAASPDAFWSMLEAGRHGIRSLPEGRWQWPPTIDPKGLHAGIDQGGFLARVDEFDALFFRTSRREAELMDPQQRLLLELSWEAIEDAGYRASSLAGREVGVFVGACHCDYRDVVTRGPVAFEGYVGSGSAFSMLSNRLSFYYDFKGPSTTVDTACSSSLFALHGAVEAIRQGRCEQALAGAVNLICSPANSVSYYGAGMLSKTGRCRTFDESADGYVRGEGGAMLLLKPLSRAIADGADVYGVIRSVAVGHGGQAASLTAPRADSQATVIANAWASARVPPESIGYIEAHGTGTPLGDPIEIAGIVEAFSRAQVDSRDGRAQCGVGSVKTNVGHLEAAAGLAGILKILLAMRRRTLPKSLNFMRRNAAIELAGTPLYLVTENRRWEPLQDAHGRVWPRRAGVSSFGFGGANAHVVLEEYCGSTPSADCQSPEVIPLSAHTPEQLVECAWRLLVHLEGSTDMPIRLCDLAFTLQTGRELMPERVTFVARTLGELTSLLRRYIDGDRAFEGCHVGDIESAAFGGARERAACRRIHLPTYPFARDSYWVHGTAGKSAQPWSWDSLRRTDDGFGADSQWRVELTGDEWFFTDHVVRGERVLPAAAYLEIVRAAVARATSGRESQSASVRLENIVWLRPVVADRRPLYLFVRLQSHGPSALRFSVCGPDSEGPNTEILYAEGDVALTARPAMSRIDVRELMSATGSAEISGADCRAAFRELGIDYGPAHQGVVSLGIGAGQIVARIERPDAARGCFVLHPGQLDAAFQATLGFSLAGDTSDRALQVPFELGCIDLFRTCTSTLWAVVRRSSTDAANAEVREVFDIDLYDDVGRPVAAIREFATRALPAVALNLAASHVPPLGPRAELLAPYWETADADVTRGADIVTSGKTLLIGGTHAQRAAIEACLPRAVDARLGSGDDVATLRRKISAQGKLAHLVWIVPDDPAIAVSGESILHAQGRGLLFGFRLIKALLAAGFDGLELSWTVVTTNACSMEAKPGDPTHAGIHGLLGVLAKEHPMWSVRLLDVDELAAVPWKKALTFRADPRGGAWAYRGGRWFRQRLGRYSAADRCVSMYQSGAVYVAIGGAGGVGEAWSDAVLRRCAAQIVWLGRRDPDEWIEAKIRRLGLLGPAPVYLRVDVTDLASLTRARDTILERFGRIDGIVHSAMDLHDGTLASLSEQDFRAGLAAKIEGSVRLAQAFGDRPLQFALFFSSVASFLKPAGQASYVAASCFEDAFVRKLASAWSCRVCVVNWGHWGDIGRAVGPAISANMRRIGLAPIEPDEANAALDGILGSDLAQAVFVRTIPGSEPEELVAVRDLADRTETEALPSNGAAAGTLCRLPSGASSNAVGEPRSLASDELLLRVRCIALDLLGTDEAVIDRRRQAFEQTLLAELGMDSLLATNLRNVLRTEFGVDLQVQRILAATVADLVGQLHEQLLLKRLSAVRRESGSQQLETIVL